ncbi:hypothetical protein Bbelb_167870 [Branchiostoma belcheri]|nr:hypothetical protein Bbelb_167870 [Branchiostoma belcheri]
MAGIMELLSVVSGENKITIETRFDRLIKALTVWLPLLVSGTLFLGEITGKRGSPGIQAVPRTHLEQTPTVRRPNAPVGLPLALTPRVGSSAHHPVSFGSPDFPKSISELPFPQSTSN